MQVEQHEMETLLGYRPRTDHRISERWLLAAIANYTVWAGLPWVFLFGILGLVPIEILNAIILPLEALGFLTSAFSAYLVYLLINRRNNHFAREQAMFRYVLETIRPKVPANDANGQWRLANNYRCYQWLSDSSGERSAILESLLVLIPYLGWFLMMFELLLLSDDWKEHELREDYMIQEINGTLSTLGLYLLPTRLRPSPVRFRSSAVYLVLSIFTLGLVELVWLYVSVSDPYEHFEYHGHFEFPLAGLLGPPKPPAGAIA